jgi:acyl-CoA synthetase (AMP-forming)/AMP-acid ligase II
VNLLHLFDLSLAARANEIALEWDGAQFTFGDLERRSNRVAHALRGRGLAKGDRLCVYLGNRIELIDIYLACVKLGVIFVPINILYRDREIAHITNDAEPKLTITEAELPRDPSTPTRSNDPAAKSRIIQSAAALHTGRFDPAHGIGKSAEAFPAEVRTQ